MTGSDGAGHTLLDEDDDGVLTVGELNRRISRVIDDADALSDVTVVGEVVNCSESNVALYFSLTDGTNSVKCLLWKRHYEDMDVDLEDGLEVLIAGDVDFYAERGRLDLKPWLVHAVGDGDRRAALEQLRADLADRGWFDDAHKRPLPTYPATVGVVTSRNGDARHDVQDTIHTRYPDVDVVVEHASVQGENAPTELATGVACLDADPAIDVIVLGRGGGSEDDLMAFNTELVADAVFHAETPIVAAVGHRADETIADAVADRFAITPTAAGELVVRDKDVALAEIADHRAGLLDGYETTVGQALGDLEAGLEDAYHDRTATALDDLDTRLVHAYETAARTGLTRLSTDLEAAYDQLEHEHEKEAAVAAARREAAEVPTAYRVAIVVLLVLLVIAILALLYL